MPKGLKRYYGHDYWSSYRSYAYAEEGKVKINQWPKAEIKESARRLASRLRECPPFAKDAGWATRQFMMVQFLVAPATYWMVARTNCKPPSGAPAMKV
jgi:hypothetical protein